MPLISKFQYRPEVDGLRALAVLGVVFFHFGLGVSGGYVGVDVFFVISGFLITSLIIKDVEAGEFSFRDFWERRARRIIPAAGVMVLTTMIAGWFLLLPSDFVGLGRSAVSQSVFAANLYFWRTTNYFGGPAEEQPLLHTWSLAVEEQFYMVMPIVLCFLHQVPAFRRRRVLGSFLGVGFAASLASSIILLNGMPAATFYLLPTRAWELLSGSLIAIAPVPKLLRLGWLRELLSAVSLTAILLPFFLYTDETLFPGAAALPPCLGTALFIWGNSQVTAVGVSPTMLSRVLSVRPVVFVGLISYSLYLWHWPLVAFSQYWSLDDFTISYRFTLLIASFLLAIVSWKYVETPFRKRRLGRSHASMFLWSGGCVTAVVIGSVGVLVADGVPNRFSEIVFNFDEAKTEALHDNRISPAVTLVDAKAGILPRFGATKPAAVRLLVWGDSHARSILPATIRAAEENDVAIVTAWHSSTPPVFGYIPHARFQGFSLGDESPAYAEAVIEEVRRRKIPNVLLAARWSGYFRADREESTVNSSQRVSLADALLQTVQALTELGVNVWILREVPNHHVPVPKALTRSAILGTQVDLYRCNPENLAQQNAEFDALRHKLERAGARIIDVSDELFDAEDGSYLMQRNGIPLYYDKHHLTRAGAESVWVEFRKIFANE